MVFWAAVVAIGMMAVIEALLDVLVAFVVADHEERVSLGLVSADGWWAALLGNALLLDLLDLPLFVGLALGTGWWLSRRAARPLRTFTRAAEQLAAERFPEPLQAPADDDELARLARSFNDMSGSIHALIERERTFTRYATHELRTPLSALKLQVDRARRAGVASSTAALDAMERNVRRMEDVIDALLSLAQTGERDRTPRSLNALVDETLAAFPAAARSRIELLSVPPDLLVTDGHLVQRALHNLVDNALTYGGRPTHVHVHRTGAFLTLRVRDGGAGVPEAALEKLPLPYFRADEHGGGLGLGLSLVALIAKTLGGRLELRNMAPGFEATVELPVVVE